MLVEILIPQTSPERDRANVATVEAAAASDAKFFFHHMPLSALTDNRSRDRTHPDARAAPVAFGVDVGLGTDFDGIHKTVRRTGVYRSHEVFTLGEIVEPGKMIDHGDRS